MTGIELGSEVPVIRRASQPYIDDRGLWVDLDITYTGGFLMSRETKCNLMKLKKATPEETRERACTKDLKMRCDGVLSLALNGCQVARSFSINTTHMSLINMK